MGGVLEARYGDHVEEIAAQLAVHFERGGELLRAVHYLQQAADNATGRNAHHDAVTTLTKGRTSLATLPDSPERMQHEITLLLILGPRLMAVKGHAVPEVGEVYTQAYTLCQEVGEPLQRCQALQGLYRYYVLQAQLRLADELSQECFRLASDEQDRPLVQEVYMDLGLIAFYRGNPVMARAHLEHSLRLSVTTRLSTLLFPNEHEFGRRYGSMARGPCGYWAMLIWRSSGIRTCWHGSSRWTIRPV